MPLPLKSPVAIISGIVVVSLALIAVWWVLSDGNVVLYDHLSTVQLDGISTELDRAGIAYRVDREKSAIIVADKDAHHARLAATSAGGPLRDTTGFELFDKSDFGMTDFAQKINYQRAMEGEIARTVGALAGVKYARVHLVVPEHGLFRDEKQKARASITLFLDNDTDLNAEQVRSVQRIAASAVPDLSTQDITVVNQNGVTLSAAEEGSEQVVSSPARLAQKKAVENYMAEKIRRVLEKALGANRFAVSVDATLDLNQKTTTTEKVLDSGPDSGIKRIKASSSRNKGEAGGEDSSKEVEYALGRESEQTIHASGEIKHIQVGVIIDSGIDGIDIAKLRELVATTAGIDLSRGDRVAVMQNTMVVQNVIQELASSESSPRYSGNAASASPFKISIFAFLTGLLLGGISLLYFHKRQQRSSHQAEVRQLRQQLQSWMSGDEIESSRS